MIGCGRGVESDETLIMLSYSTLEGSDTLEGGDLSVLLLSTGV